MKIRKIRKRKINDAFCLCVLFGSVNMNIIRVLILIHSLLRNMGLCFMQLVTNFSPPQKKDNARGVSSRN